MKEEIRKIVKAEGFSDCGFLPFSAVKDNLFDVRAKEQIPKNAKTIIMAVIPYYPGEKPERNISLYAVLPDYHKSMLIKLQKVIEKIKKLYPYNEFAAFVDNSPIPEVYCAQLCGLGVRGINNLLITKEYGSYVFICEIITNLELDSTQVFCPERCVACNACISACPTGALQEVAGRVLFNKNRCIAALNQKKQITPDEEELLKKSATVWGCDICQQVCPENQHIKPVLTENNDTLLWRIESDDISGLSENEYRERYSDRAFAYKGKKIMLRNIELWEDKDR